MPTSISPRAHRAIFFACVLSFCSFSYELLIAREIAFLMGDYIFWQSMTIGFFLVGLGLGSGLSSRLNFSHNRLFNLEIIVAILGLLSIPLVLVIHIMYRKHSNDDLMLAMPQLQSIYQQNIPLSAIGEIKKQAEIGFLLLSQTLVLLIGILSGLEIPYLFKYANDKYNNLIIAANFSGSLLSSLAVTFIFQRVLTSTEAALAVSLLNLAIAALLIPDLKKDGRLLLKFASVLVVYISIVPRLEKLERLDRTLFYYYQYNLLESPVPFSLLESFARLLPDIEVKKTLYQTMEKLSDTEEENDNKPAFTVFLDGHFQFASRSEATYHESMTRIPLLLIGSDIKRILVLGAGDGLLLRDLLQLVNSKVSIDHVELDQEFHELSKRDPDIKALNRGALESQRVNTIFDDGFSFLRQNKNLYDLIIIDFPYPYSFDLLKLYSVEFYKFLFRSMHEGSLAIIDTPIFSKSPVFEKKHVRHNSIIFSTLDFAGFKHRQPFQVKGETFIAFCKKWNSNQRSLTDIDASQLTAIGKDEWLLNGSREFPHEIHKRYVNSIFKPTMSGFRDEMF